MPIGTPQNFTDQQLLALHRANIAGLAVAEDWTLNGKSVRRCTVAESITIVNYLEERINIVAAGPNAQVALAQFNQQQSPTDPTLGP